MGKPGDVEYEQNQRDKGLVDKKIRPLCVSLLGSGIDERKALESSIGGILRKNEEWDEETAKRERKELEERLRKLREEKTRVNRRLRDIRESETHSQSIAEGAYLGTAARIAEAVNRDKPNYEWFTDTVPLDNTCPLSASDLRSALAILRHFTPERRKELSLVWPKALPSTEHFADLVQNEARAIEEEHRSTSGADEHTADLLSRTNAPTIDGICKALSDFRATCRNLMASPHTWVRDALRDVSGGNSTLWRALSHVTGDAIASIETLVAVADDTSIEFPDTTNIRTLREDARKLKEHMENGGKLGWGPFRPKAVKECLHVIKSVRIGILALLSNTSQFSRIRCMFELSVRRRGDCGWDGLIGLKGLTLCN